MMDGGGGWSDDCESETGAEAKDEDEQKRDERLRAEFKKSWDEWRRAMKTVDWRAVDQSMKQKAEKPGIVELMQADIGPMYAQMERSGKYGHLPRMAGCSVGQLGALNAESFAERVLSCANNVLTTGNTLLSDEEVEMLVILRMNRAFMEFMRTHYGHIVKQQFNQTIVDADLDDD